MDDPLLDARAHARALRGLARINAISRTAATLWPLIEKIAQARRDDNLRVLDIATGGGDVPIALATKARKQGLALVIEGCDVSATAIANARAAAVRANAPAQFFQADVLAGALPAHYDIVTSSLFLHHLTDGQIVMLFRMLAAGADHVLISDLIRDRGGYALAWAGTRVLSRSPVVHIDGLRSVRAALTLEEARGLATRAGLAEARFERRWPRRFLMSWHRDG